MTSPGSTFRVDELAAATPADSFLLTRAEGVAETTRGGDTKVVKGQAVLEEELAGLRFRISPDAFFQTNTEMAERLYGTAVELAAPERAREGARPVLRHRDDLARCSPSTPAEVWGVELVEEAVADAIENAKLNGDRQRALLRRRRPARDARAARALRQPGRGGGGPAARRPLAEGGAADHRGGGRAGSSTCRATPRRSRPTRARSWTTAATSSGRCGRWTCSRRRRTSSASRCSSAPA